MNASTPAALALSTLMALVIGGCGGSDSSSTTDPIVTPPGGDGGGGDGGGGDGGGTVGGSGGGDSGIVTGIIDRMGRPGVSTALIRTDADEDAYNANGDPSTWVMAFSDPMLERLRLIDGLDGTVGNALLGDAETLAGVLLDDRLQVDTSESTCNAYLGLEIGLGGCGGRALEIDVIDDTLRHLVSQDMPVSDLADGTEKINRLPGEWPFLAEPI